MLLMSVVKGVITLTGDRRDKRGVIHQVVQKRTLQKGLVFDALSLFTG